MKLSIQLQSRGAQLLRCIPNSSIPGLSLALIMIGQQTLFSMGGPYPERLKSKRDINAAKADATDIDIRNLPLELYPLLAKFKGVKQIDFANIDPDIGSNEKLEVLSQLGFTNLTVIILTNCRRITDAGLRSLVKVRSLTGLGLEGTSVTDIGCEIMASEMKLTGVNVNNCRLITKKGILSLADSPIDHFSFSALHLKSDEILEIIQGLRSNVKRIDIIDPEGKLDAKQIEAQAATKGVRILVRRKGAALQTLFKLPPQ